MGFIFEATIVEFFLGVLLLLWLIFTFLTSDYSYWKKRSIAYVKPSFPFGTDKDFFFMKQQIGYFYHSVYTKFMDEKVVGMMQLGRPYLLIRDPELLKQIMTKDFHHFVDRGVIDPDVLRPTLKHILHLKGNAWRSIRNKLTPAFTSGKMKRMFYLMEACSNELVKALEPIAADNGKIAVKDFMARFTTDVIASCAFGLQSNSLQNPNSEFRANGKKIVDSSPSLQMCKLIISSAFPWLIKLHIIKRFDFAASDAFMKLIADTVAYREENGSVRNDFIDALMKIKNNQSLLDEEKIINTTEEIGVANGKPGLTLEEMTAQSVVFFVAGFESGSSTMAFCLYEISQNPEVQAKMRKEIDVVLSKHNGKITYEALQEMTYMDAVIYETLRRHVSVPVLNRQCTEDYKVPGLDLVIPKGMKIVIPVFALHHDHAYYPDPYKFDPERFTDDKMKTKNNYTYMPFGEGPRMCLGNRFAMMQMKSCLSLLLHNYELAITEETHIPITVSRKQFITTPEYPIILKISKRAGYAHSLLDRLPARVQSVCP